ncbi:Flp pilus assembly protein CpaB [Actinomadura parmotrematis]|uniref:Flp pilus assembly protein CpaB n=1 Tax=Actinomadura parmotrematis TaxID=2864039 RepID=A0ABS7FWZ5_9ACTN|nr:Flp pilus assembly protein CpaB [Actinomadura parmotrematis]MBW8484949.1 Flp pilus assembly protein CpaB [Actinomadura parmotrematis]
MNPRQRRGVLLMLLAALGSVAVFISVIGYVGSVRAEVGVKTDVLVLRHDVAAYAPVTSADLQRMQIPRKWSPAGMITDLGELDGQVAAADLRTGAYLQAGMLVPGPTLQPGQREIAIMIDAETGVAGKVHKGMYVDIYATYTTPDAQKQRSCAARIVKAARVIQIGQLTSVKSTKENTGPQSAVPITFALQAADSLKLAREESFASKIRLALIGGTGQGADNVKLPPVCETVPAR